MMGQKQEAQAALFCEFSLEDHVPPGHLLRSIGRFVDLDDIRQYLADFYSRTTGRPSVDPELLIPCPAWHRIAMFQERGCCWSAIVLASGLNAVYGKKCT